jgi:hypothetical protein
MPSMFSAIFLFLLAQPPAAAPADAPAVVAQRAAAEALEVQGIFSDAGDAYVKLADLPGVDRRSALDKAHLNYDSAYLTTKNPSRLCRALGVAEQVVGEGGFNDADQASYWKDTVDDDLRRLRADAQATHRPNCRFAASGSPRANIVATLTDDDFAELGPTADPGPPQKIDRPPATRRWRAQTASAAVFSGLGIGFLGAFAGALAIQSQHAKTLQSMTAKAKAESRDFTDAEWRNFNNIRDDGLQVRNVAIGMGVAGVIALTTGVALLVTRKTASRTLALHPYGGPLEGGAVLRVDF